MPAWLKNLDQRNVYIDGEVASARDFMSSKSIMIVPLFSGSGMRIKIVEGLALEKVIVSTTLGAAGIDYEDGKNLLIANSRDEFVDKVSFLLENPKQRRAIGKRAGQLARTAYDNDVVTRNLCTFFSELMTAATA